MGQNAAPPLLVEHSRFHFCTLYRIREWHPSIPARHGPKCSLCVNCVFLQFDNPCLAGRVWTALHCGSHAVAACTAGVAHNTLHSRTPRGVGHGKQGSAVVPDKLTVDKWPNSKRGPQSGALLCRLPKPRCYWCPTLSKVSRSCRGPWTRTWCMCCAEVAMPASRMPASWQPTRRRGSLWR